MDKKSKIFLWFFFFLIVGSVAITYYRIIVKRDYIIEAQTDCDPTIEKCFIYHCDPAAEECSGDETQDTSYYKISKRKAYMIPNCDPADENCKPFACGENEKACEEVLCSEQTKQETDECNDPEQYNIDNPPVEEENVTCDPAEDPTCEAEDTSGTEDDPASLEEPNEQDLQE
jgi:hypothetical protein